MDVAEIVSFINAEHDTSFSLRERLAGGYQDGAYHLTDARTGQHAVLKRHFAARAILPVQQLYRVGYPVPELLFTGHTSDGSPYWVQAFVSGQPMEIVTEPFLDQIFALNDLQANLHPEASSTEQSWSQYAYDVVFANASGRRAQLQAATPTTAAFLASLDHLTRPYAQTVLPETDIVHGDFTPDNLLIRDGQIVAVIDIAFAGAGTRIIDLVTICHYAYLYDYAPTVRTQLREQILQQTTRGIALICAAYRALAMIAWALKHDPHDVVLHYTQQSWAMLRDMDTVM